MHNDEITFKDLVLKIQEYYSEAIKRWRVLVIFTILGISFFIFKHTQHIPIYHGEVQFIVEAEDNNIGLSGVKGLMKTMGLRNKTNGVNAYKILGVARSLNIISKTLFTKSKKNNQFYINNIIDNYNLIEPFLKLEPDLKGYKFTKSNVDSFNIEERRIFKSALVKTIGNDVDFENAILTINLDDKSGIFSISSNSEFEDLATELPLIMYNELKFFFEEEINQEKKQTRDLLNHKRDSINAELNRRIVGKANLEDRSRGIALNIGKTELQRINVEIAGLTSVLSEIQKNLELSDFEYRDSKPFFMKISKPYPPLTPSRSSLIISLISGILLGVVCGSIIIFSSKLYKELMK